MNAYRQILENVLFEFDWGQSETGNAIEEPTKFDLPVAAISENAEYECFIARYLNWYVKCQEYQAATGTDLLNTEEAITFRSRTLAAFQARLVKSDQNHPAMLVYAHDCRVYQNQDSIACFHIAPVIVPLKLKLTEFILVYK